MAQVRVTEPTGGGPVDGLRCDRCGFESDQMAAFFGYILPGWGWVGVGVGEVGTEYQKWCPSCIEGLDEDDGPIPVEDYSAYRIPRSPHESPPADVDEGRPA